MIFRKKDWLEKVSNRTQIGGIETSVLDNGAGRGTRIAWINTGTGLRFKVVLDRAMDIAEAFFNQYSLCWISELGIIKPQPFSDKGADWLRTFGGGLLVTCGLTHTGGAESDDFGSRGLHDQISNCSAEVISIVQPDIHLNKLDMSITGIMRQGHPLGPKLELKRTIRATLGEAKIYIEDEVINRGNTAVPHMLLYHFNFGWPLVDNGSRILWSGRWQTREEGEAVNIFKEENDFRNCLAPIDEHQGAGEEAAFIDINADEQGLCTCGIHNKDLALAVSLTFNKDELPWLTNWQHWGKYEYVTGLEPGTHPPIGQGKARASGQLLFLDVGERKTYHLTLEVLDQPVKINRLLYKTQTN